MIDVAWAQGAASGAPPAYAQLAPIVVLMIVFYFLMIRPQQQKQKEHQNLLANLKKNDQVITTGGLYGRVMALADDFVTLEIAPNVKVQVARPQIATVIMAKPSGGAATNDKEKDKAK